MFSIVFTFSSGESLKATGENPKVGLTGERRYIEDAGRL